MNPSKPSSGKKTCGTQTQTSLPFPATSTPNWTGEHVQQMFASTSGMTVRKVKKAKRKVQKKQAQALKIEAVKRDIEKLKRDADYEARSHWGERDELERISQKIKHQEQVLSDLEFEYDIMSDE